MNRVLQRRARASKTLLYLLLCVALLAGGCHAQSADDAAVAPADDSQADARPVEGFKLGDLVPPFKPPTLAELEKNVEWEDRPVLDAFQLREKFDAAHPAPGTIAQALAARNTSDAANDLILGTLGRLPAPGDKVDYGSTVVRRAGADVKSTNTLLMSSTIEMELAVMLHAGLFNSDWEMKPFGDAQTIVSWQSSKDRLYDKVVMRDDVTWSDGEPFTAHDVAFTFQVIMTSSVPVMAVRTGTDQLKWVEAYDDRTVVFFHQESQAVNDWNINFPIICKHVYEKTIPADPTLATSKEHAKLAREPITSGPYVLTGWTANQSLRLERREGWYMHNGKQVRRKPLVEHIRFDVVPDSTIALLALKGGQIDETVLSPEQWVSQTDGDDFYDVATKVRALEWTYFYIGWNLKTPFFSDLRVRKAMAYSIDYEHLLKRLRFGLNEQSSGVFHPSTRWAPQPELPFYQRDMKKAERLLVEAGWTDSDNDGVRDKTIDGVKHDFSFTILCRTVPEQIEICNMLARNLRQLGIECHVQSLEFTVIQDRLKKHQFEANFGGWGAGADPYSLANIFSSTGERNFGCYSNAEVDKLFDEGKRELDPNKRRDIYRRLATLMYEDQPYSWLYLRSSYYGFRKDLRGYMFSPAGPYLYGPGFDTVWRPAME